MSEIKDKFILKAPYQPTGDQPQAIDALVQGVLAGDKCQSLLGVTGSGKTFTMANVIARLNRPTLVLAHNKTLTREVILNELWDDAGHFVDDNTLSVYVRRLREKVETDPSNPAHLITVRGFGYEWKEDNP